MLPPREDKDHPAIDLDLHLPFLCFKPHQLLQVLLTFNVCVNQVRIPLNCSSFCCRICRCCLASCRNSKWCCSLVIGPDSHLWLSASCSFCRLLKTHISLLADSNIESIEPCMTFSFPTFLFVVSAFVMAAALCSCPVQRHAGLFNGSNCLSYGMSPQPFCRGCSCEYITFKSIGKYSK